MMKRWITLIACLLFPALGFAQQLAFPSAEGFGRLSVGGRGGIVCHVDTLAGGSSGNQIAGKTHHRGTFDYCRLLSGARTVVIDVAGKIDNSNSPYTENPFITIAGQTAPGEGVYITGGLQLRTHNIIVRYMRMRRLDTVSNSQNITIARPVGTSLDPHDVIIDHCSVSWATDDQIGWTDAQDTTVQWCIDAEGLSGGTFSKAMLPSHNSRTGTLHHNLMAHFFDRAPQVSARETQMVNNYIYNIDGSANVVAARNPVEIEYIGNYFRQGPSPGSSTLSTRIQLIGPSHGCCSQANVDGSRINLSGNIAVNVSGTGGSRPNNTFPESSLVYVKSGTGSFPIISFAGYPALPSQTDAFEASVAVLDNAGATIPLRDLVDLRVLNDVQTGAGTGKTRLDNVPAPGYPVIPFVERDSLTYDTDWDGMPDAWETACSGAVDAVDGAENGLSNSDEADGANVLASGYTALEHYLNEIAGDYQAGTCGGLSGGDATPPSTPTMNAPTVAAYDQIDLSWPTATDGDSGIGSYIVLWCEGTSCTPVNAENVGNVTSYSHVGRTGSTIYGYQVQAVNGAGLPGDLSTPVEYATTDAPPTGDTTSNLVSRWTFDNTPNDAVSTNHGTLQNGATYDASGRVNQALLLTGGNQHVSIGDVLNVGAGEPFTVTLWVKGSVTNTDQYAITKRGAVGYQVRFTTSGGFFVRMDEASGITDTSTSATVMDGQWHHVAAGRSLTQHFIMIDGQTVNTANDATVADLTDAVALTIGGDGTEGWVGSIDDARFYSRALTQIDVQALIAEADTDISAPTVPQNLTATPLNDEFQVFVSLSWDASTDDIGPITYRIQKCEGQGCSNFTDLFTTSQLSATDMDVQPETTYRYQVQAEDAASPPNVSGYSTAAEAMTNAAPPIIPGPPTILSTTAATVPTFPGSPTGLTTSAATVPTIPSAPTGPSNTADPTVTFPGAPTGLTTP